MTNGEMIQKDFNCEVCEPIIEDDIIHVIFADKKDSAIAFDWSWWNEEYKEPTIKNDCAEQNGCITCSLDDGDDCCRKLYEENMQEPTTKNDLGVDCISRADARSLICNTDIKHRMFGMSRKVFKDLYNGMDELPSVTPQESRWIPVSERLPKDLEPVNITWINHDPEPYYNDIKDKPFTATGVYFNGQWYWWSTLCTDILAEYSHNYDDIIDDAIEITAWMPLPTSYQGEKNDA